MNATKKINVNFSSLVGLKAELLRKQAEVNQAKMRSDLMNAAPKIKKTSKKPKEKAAKEKAEELTDVEDIKTHKKSKLMLEAKARLYDRLKRSRNNNENFLVDFSNKSDESEEDRPGQDDAEDDSILDIDEDEEGWVEYVDCFGRTRKCLREDLPAMQEKDEFLKEQVMNKRNQDDADNTEQQQPTVVEKEPEIEIMRKKWEEQTEKLADKANIHYQDVLFDEARTHGVGYYAFSQDEEQRTKQQENLAKLRKETEQRQNEMKELKELRTKMEENRLKAARIRQRIRAGLPAEPTEEELSQAKTEETETSDSPNRVAEENTVPCEGKSDSPEQKVDRLEDESVVQESKIRALGELLGKKTRWYEMSQEEWVDKRRKVRVTEFGPVYENFNSAGYLEATSSQKESEIGQKYDDSTSNMEYNADEKSEIVQPSTVTLNIHNSTEEQRQINIESIESNVQVHDAVNGNINEENIMAGLKYLREKFEETRKGE